MKRISTNDFLFRRRLQHLTKAKNLAALLAACVLAASAARADSQTGHITRVTYVGSTLMIMLDTGPPTSCSATPFGWMMVPASYTPMIAFVSGLWFRGDAAAKSLGVYTSGIDGSGYCQISQIDTGTAG
jgi:hypothetical protein